LVDMTDARMAGKMARSRADPKASLWDCRLADTTDARMAAKTARLRAD
jgi:hypothetical protein